MKSLLVMGLFFCSVAVASTDKVATLTLTKCSGLDCCETDVIDGVLRNISCDGVHELAPFEDGLLGMPLSRAKVIAEVIIKTGESDADMPDNWILKVKE